MDFRSGKVLGEEIDADYEPLRFGGGYDHNWVLKNEGSFGKVVEVTADKSGIRMEVYTDLPGVQMYTGNFLGGVKGKDGAVYEKRSAVCLETQYYPDAVHHDYFPGRNTTPGLHTALCRANRGTPERFLFPLP